MMLTSITATSVQLWSLFLLNKCKVLTYQGYVFSWGMHWTYGVMLQVSFRSFNCSHWKTTKRNREKVWGTECSLQSVSWLWTSEIFQLICSARYITHSSLSHVILSSQGWTMFLWVLLPGKHELQPLISLITWSMMLAWRGFLKEDWNVRCMLLFTCPLHS